MLDLGGRAHRHRNAGSVSVKEHARHARQLPHQGDVEHQLPLPGTHRKAPILAQALVKISFTLRKIHSATLALLECPNAHSATLALLLGAAKASLQLPPSQRTV